MRLDNPGGPQDKRIKQAIFISENKLMKIVQDAISKFISSTVPVFSQQSEALDYLVKRIELDEAKLQNA